MFFADTLGPSFESVGGSAMLRFIQEKAGRGTMLTAQQLSAIAAEYLLANSFTTTPDAAIQHLVARGRIRTDDFKTFSVAV